MALIPGNMLSEDAQSIETSIAGWDAWHPGSSAVDRVSTFAHDGTWSLRVTSNGTADLLCGRDRAGFFVFPNQSYTFTAWVYTTLSGHTLGTYANFWRSNGTTFTEAMNETPVAVSPNTWTQLSSTYTPTDPTTALSDIYITITTTPISGDFFYADEIFFGVTGPRYTFRNSSTT